LLTQRLLDGKASRDISKRIDPFGRHRISGMLSGCSFFPDSVPDKEDFPFDMEFRSWKIFFEIDVC